MRCRGKNGDTNPHTFSTQDSSSSFRSSLEDFDRVRAPRPHLWDMSRSDHTAHTSVAAAIAIRKKPLQPVGCKCNHSTKQCSVHSCYPEQHFSPRLPSRPRASSHFLHLCCRAAFRSVQESPEYPKGRGYAERFHVTPLLTWPCVSPTAADDVARILGEGCPRTCVGVNAAKRGLDDGKKIGAILP